MTATEAVLRARRAAQIAQHQLDRHPHFSLDRQQALQLIRAIGELAGQINEAEPDRLSSGMRAVLRR